ncbi:hypothetical protein [Methanococcoides alaskense]|uniref:Transposase-like protein n=1 Tax=Methanococcoides alaskense TaxID=325778 RepID=A0AA90Z6H0_9EURY|nr:hypothetical protein [Methanococcoides alaskense]MDA0525105.1 hypothetical protein [Methanococcoides alaskense]MDR6221974.1 transposase-like protein [Methanococcoides alaskense]
MTGSLKCHRCEIGLKRMKIGGNLMYYCRKCGSTTSVDTGYKSATRSNTHRDQISI